jgi:GMP synthase-like glutamine amidotransferase
MKIGILKTDAVRPEWVPTFGEYPDMFERVLKLVDPDLEFEVWDIEEGEFPTTLDGIDGFIITGSKSSVYDDKPWIRSLEALVRELYEARKKVIGICFGHQLIAQALGGLVDKSPKGWGVGPHVPFFL